MLAKENVENQTMKTARVFGEIAIKAGFLTPGQLDEALDIQRDFNTISSERLIKRIGDILFEKGWMSVEQIYKVQVDVFNHMCEISPK